MKKFELFLPLLAYYPLLLPNFYSYKEIIHEYPR